MTGTQRTRPRHGQQASGGRRPCFARARTNSSRGAWLPIDQRQKRAFTPELSRLAICLARRSKVSDVQAHGVENEGLQSGLRYLLTFTEIDGADAAAVQARVEEHLRVLHLGTFGNVNRTAFLSISPVHTMPSRDHTGTPSGLEGFFHFTSSTTAGPAPRTIPRRRDSVSPRQSPDFLMMASIS